MITIIDTATKLTPQRLHLLKQQGIVAVGRYIDCLQSHGKDVITPIEAKQIADEGMYLFLVYEADGRPLGSQIGSRDGHFARTYSAAVGAPEGACIYYAVDYDVTRANVAATLDAFEAFRNEVSPAFQVGCYGSGFILGQLEGAKLIEKRWLASSRGWAGTLLALARGAYDLRQALPEELYGVVADPDTMHVARAQDFGAFIPYA